MNTFDVSLQNTALWQGCEITEVAGRKNVVTPMQDAVNIIGKNVESMNLKGEEITLTGAAPVWAYLVVFHAVVHRFSKVVYDDGRGGSAVVAIHAH